MNKTKSNNQEQISGKNANTSPTAPKKVEELSEVGCDRKSTFSPESQQVKPNRKENTLTKSDASDEKKDCCSPTSVDESDKYVGIAGNTQTNKKKIQNMKKEELAEWLHNNYEEIARRVGWITQKSCKVEFNDLPTKNKMVMLKLARRIHKRIN